MIATDSNPSQKNFLNTTQFKLVMKRAPNIQFFVQKMSIPGISTDDPEQQTPFIAIPWPGVQMKYEPFRMSFKVSEDLADYLEIWNWLHGESTAGVESFAPLVAQTTPTGTGLKSDIVLMILDSAKNPKLEVTFHDAFPTSLSGIDFSSTEDQAEYPVVDAVFRYSSFDIASVI
jgi:hypothetical protein